MNKESSPEMNKRLLVVDDERNMRHMLSTMLGQLGYGVDTAENGAEALRMIAENEYDFVLCDLKMPQMSGMEFLKAAKEYLSDISVIVMSAYGSIDTAIEAMKLGAYDYISKPFKTDEVHLALKKAEERESLRRENTHLRERLKSIEGEFHFVNMIGKSPAMRSVFRLTEKIAQYGTTVLITGESGTGKELIARAIHRLSERHDAPFIPINCGGIPDNLLESEFFGYKKGAFTGADRNKKGLFEEADGGILFLDEVGELPLSLQVKFLRVLQESEVRPIGDAKTKSINVRILAATAKNLEEQIVEGTFRQDLFYRLNVMPIKLPALRNRTEDIPLLCDFFIKKLNIRLNKDIKQISGEAMTLLLKHTWPGNVRELENAIERALILCDEEALEPQHFFGEGLPEAPSSSAEDMFSGYSLKESQKILEKKMIMKALKATNGNRTKATQLLEISHPSLLSKMKAYGIE